MDLVVTGVLKRKLL